MTLDEAIKHEEEIVKEEQYEYQECVATHNMEGAMNCRKYAEEHRQLAEWLKDYKRLREQARWIPVSERLPNFNDIILASTNSDYDELRIVLTVYNAERFWFDGKIAAWMPLPEPYKTES